MTERTEGSLSEAELAKLRTDQAEIVNAFRAKHGADADSVAVELKKVVDGRLLWSVRKMSAAEREARTQDALRRDVAAMGKAEQRTYVYVPGKVKWWQRPFTPTAVYLSEKGAREAGESPAVIKVEVRA